MSVDLWQLNPREIRTLIREKGLEVRLDGCSLEEARQRLHELLCPEEPTPTPPGRRRRFHWPRVGTQKEKIVQAVRDKWTTDQEVADKTGLPLEIVRLRLYEAKRRKRLEFRKLLQYRQPPQ